MKYAVLIYESDTDFAKRTDPKEAPAYWGRGRRTRRR